MEELIKRIEAIADEHPYKVVGDTDTYSQYNEAWTDACDRILSVIQSLQSDGWIPVASGRLPEEKVNPITQDYYEYECTVDFGVTGEIRHYKFGDGHWRLSGAVMDKYILAWRENPAPYNPQKETK